MVQGFCGGYQGEADDLANTMILIIERCCWEVQPGWCKAVAHVKRVWAAQPPHLEHEHNFLWSILLVRAL